MIRQAQTSWFSWILLLRQITGETVTDMVRKVAECVFIPFTVGGGIRTVDDFRAILREGADKVSVNSSAINNPRLISDAADKFGQSVCSRSY